MMMTLNMKIERIRACCKEFAFGYNDCSDSWMIHYGPRGTGSMLEDIGSEKFLADTPDFEEAIDLFMHHIGLRSFAGTVLDTPGRN